MTIAANALAFPRRTLLRTAGLLAGAAAALTVFPPDAAAAGPAGRRTLRLGLLLPQSAPHPQYAANFTAGLRLAFQQANQPVALQTPEIGRGAGLVASTIEQLLDLGAIDLLVGMVSAEIAAGFRDLLADRDLPFIAATVGANIPRHVDSSPHLFHYTLSHWQASWALGRWAATNLGRRGVIATSFYDSGFDAHHAFRLGFEASGGTIVLAHTTHVPPGSGGSAQLVAPLVGQRADFVYAAYCGQAAVDFIRAHARAGLKGRLPLIGPSFLTDERILPDLGSAAVGIRTASAWASDLATTENRAFVASHRARAGQTPDPLALLGYETAQLIAGAAAAAPPIAGESAAFRDALARARFTGPRGAVALDARTREQVGPLYLRQVKATKGAVVNATEGALTPPDSADRSIEAVRGSLKTGWLAPYLCG